MLRQDREKALIKIRNYQKQIDSYATEIAYFEKWIDVLHNRIKAQLGDMRAKRQEAIHLRDEADRL